ncbi:MAG: magnesium transporter [Candidatus Aenigmatarchaeota archaeon]|nr:magnesium transporter [Candidatus Aenigmarchaeota archaeon]
MKKITLLKKLTRIKRYKHHPLIHRIHETHKISRKTLFYMKEYGQKSHVASVILKESLPSLIIAFIIGSISGISLQTIGSNFILFAPLLILLPALNDMIGDYSMIMVARISTLLFTKRIAGNWWISEDIRKIVRTIALVAILSAIYIGLISSLVAYLKGFPFTLNSFVKVMEVSILTTSVMVSIVILISGFGVFYVYKRKEDPNNLVMPVMTSVADLGTILIFALFVALIF